MNTNTLPLVSVIITSYNCEKYIADAIQSACQQDYCNLEIIISDNCSSDRSPEIIESYLSDKRIRYSRNNKNIGMMANFLKATKELANGEYVTYISSDDFLINSSFISDAIKILNKYSSVEMAHGVNLSKFEQENLTQVDYSASFYQNIYYNKEYVSGIDVIKSFPKCHAVSFGGSIFNRSRLLDCEPFKDNTLSGDTQVILQLLLKCDVAFINKHTYIARRHSGSATFSQASARVYINNLAYIDKPFSLYLTDENFTTSEAEKWRIEMYINACRHSLIKLYVADRTEFYIFKEYLKSNHFIVYNRITNNLRWLIFLLLNKNVTIATRAEKFRKYISVIKLKLTKYFKKC